MSISTKEYDARRKRLSKSLSRGVGVVFAGRAGDPFHADSNFQYLTGLDDEPGAVLLLDPSNPNAGRRACLFLEARDPDVERWDGERPEIDQALRERLGISSIFRMSLFPRLLRDAARRAKKLACLHPLALHTEPASKDFALFREVAGRIPGVAIEDASEALPTARTVKSPAEQRLIATAAQITTEAYDEVLRTLRPGLNEWDIQEVLEHTYRSRGSRRTAYDSIVGGGRRGTILHYRDNREILEEGDLVCIDSAATWAAYTADVTRTFPVSGKFTKRQKDVYGVVLRALDAGIRAVEPGATLAKIDSAARKVIDKAGFGDRFPHSIGHHLGLDVHDPAPDTPLQVGAVITVEPGIYLPDEAMGIRIEDDIVVTKSGRKNLTSSIPKKIADIENAMAKGQKSK